MVPWSRRTLLRATAGVGSVALAGCSGFGQSTETDEPPPPGDPVRNYEQRVVHVPGEQPLFRLPDADRSDQQVLLTAPSDRDDIRFTDRGERLSAFVDATSFDDSSVALFQRTFPECRRLGVQTVRRRPDELRAELCIPRRPADVACRTDRRRSGAVALRVRTTDVSDDELAATVGSQCRPQLGPLRTTTGDTT
ncbi:hypothetical protein [Haloarcula halophila]|uniref:hypothetical protein n=1 Tax=Haloarcula TaxID=2237 RepID=UPI0023E45CC6|nr:hypothetical protein [Halomicroarcula sp. DFY41]